MRAFPMVPNAQPLEDEGALDPDAAEAWTSHVQGKSLGVQSYGSRSPGLCALSAAKSGQGKDCFAFALLALCVLQQS